MNSLTLALRNVSRNRRRSTITVIAIAVGTAAVSLAGGFVATIQQGVLAGIVRNDGHLHVYPKGYLEYGSSRPDEFHIDRPGRVAEVIRATPELSEAVKLTTPFLRFGGIAGNYAERAGKTFLGFGLVPADQNRMRQWRRDLLPDDPLPLDERDAEGGVIGVGLARMLSLCDELALTNCRDYTAPVVETPVDAGVAEAMAMESGPVSEPVADPRPRIDLLASGGDGAPNVVSLYLRQAKSQSQAALDDSYVAMNLPLAQRLLYGGADRASGVVVQLHRTEDARWVAKRLETALVAAGLNVEVRGIGEFAPMFDRVVAMFGAIFTFLSVVIGVVVLFTIVNTVTMSVMERVGEIGTLRSMGLRRGGVRRLFIAEGWVLGVFGATAGVLTGLLAAELINASGLTWTPPSNAEPLPLIILLSRSPHTLFWLWAGMTAVATLSALPPANRAARMTIVDAIRHV